MMELDQIMRQNELTIAVVAALPALAIAGVLLSALRTWLTTSPPDTRWEALPVRRASQHTPSCRLDSIVMHAFCVPFDSLAATVPQGACHPARRRMITGAASA